MVKEHLWVLWTDYRFRDGSTARGIVRLPDDIKQLALTVWSHRLVLDAEAEFAGITAESIVSRALADVAAPQTRSEAA